MLAFIILLVVCLSYVFDKTLQEMVGSNYRPRFIGLLLLFVTLYLSTLWGPSIFILPYFFIFLFAFSMFLAFWILRSFLIFMVLPLFWAVIGPRLLLYLSVVQGKWVVVTAVVSSLATFALFNFAFPRWVTFWLAENGHRLTTPIALQNNLQWQDLIVWLIGFLLALVHGSLIVYYKGLNPFPLAGVKATTS